jgi:DNA polymerase-3 subunit alpha
MREILEETHGVMVYQEQVMRILNRLGGIELSKAYTCIKAISKKKLEIIARFREQFVEGACGQGLTESQAHELFNLIEKFAGYGFNKSHSTAYALIAYQTAYLKAHYPVEFMAALLSGDIPGRNFKKKDSLVEHLEDCRRMGVEVLPPDVKGSLSDFGVADGKIVFGLAAVKGCGGAAAEALVAQRRAGGPFADLFDFCERVDPAECNRTALESLIKAGAFDSTGARRAQLWQSLDRALQGAAAVHADRRSGQRGLFDEAAHAGPAAADARLPDVPEWDERQKLAQEKEVLGFYLTSHPLAEHAETLRTYATHSTVEAAALPGRTEVSVGGMLGAVKHAHARNPRPGAPSKYAMFDLEDLQGVLRTICWPEQFAQYGHLLQADAVLHVRGTIDKRPGSEEANLIVNEVLTLEELPQRRTRGVVLHVDQHRHGERGLEQLREILRGYPGTCEVDLELTLADQTRVRLKSQTLRVSPEPEMRRRVEELLGPGGIRLVAAPVAPSAPSRGNGAHRMAAAR